VFNNIVIILQTLLFIMSLFMLTVSTLLFGHDPLSVNNVNVASVVECLECFDAVGWASGRACGL